jgi:membrane dipeptidase
MRLPLLRSLVLLLLPLFAAACSGPQRVSDAPERAHLLARDAIIVDGHIDVPYRLRRAPDDVGEATETGDFDYPRAEAGGLDAPFMSIYIPASYQETGGAKALADSLIDMVEGIVAAHPDKFALAASPAEVRANHAAGLISLPLGIENGAPVEGNLANLEHFYERGVRYITLTHSRDNEISDSSYDTTATHGGLSDFGREVVREMNRLGIMVDVSHISDAAFDDVMEVTTAPVIASHSSARHFTPGFERNLDDVRIRRLAENGGVLMINFGSYFLTEEYQIAREAASDHVAVVATERGWEPGSPEYRDYAADYRRRTVPYADLQDVVDHINHVVNLVGVDHVGLGSDYDGVGDSLPTGLKDVAAYPNLVAALLDEGYSETDVRKILGENALRVWAEVERIAATN